MNCESFILIGGKSSRMGKDKFALALNGKTFLEIAVQNLKNFGDVSVVVSEQTNFVNNFPIVKDIYQNRGALGGIHSALVNSKSDWTITLACDYPFVTVELVSFLTNLAKTENEFDAFAPIQADGKIQPLCAVYKTETCRQVLSKILENEAENYSVRDFLNQIKTRYIEFSEISHLPNSENFFFNINTPEDFVLAAKLHENYKRKTAVKIVPMVVDDIEEVIKIQQESSLSYWSYDGYKTELEKEDSFLIVAKMNNQTIGFLVAGLIRENNCAEIYNIAVSAIFRRKKIGEELLNNLTKHCIKNELRQIFLEVRESNKTAIQFYLKNNFTVLSQRKNFYSNPSENAVTMINEL